MSTPPVEPSTPPPADDATPARRPWWRRWWAIAIAVVIVGLIIDVAVGPHTTPSSNAAPSSSAAPTTSAAAPVATTPVRTSTRPVSTTTRPAVPNPPADTLTGYGATVAAWDRAHTADTNYAAGSAYDPDPSLPPANGRTADRYVAVQPLGGHVTDYMINFRATSLSGAESVVAREFPADARVLWTQPLAGCTIVEYASATVHAALGNTDAGDAQVVYASQQPGASTVDEATLTNTPGAAPDPAASC